LYVGSRADGRQDSSGGGFEVSLRPGGIQSGFTREKPRCVGGLLVAAALGLKIIVRRVRKSWSRRGYAGVPARSPRS